MSDLPMDNCSVSVEYNTEVPELHMHMSNSFYFLFFPPEFLCLVKLESDFIGRKSSTVGEKRDGLLLKGGDLVPENTRLPFAVSSSCLIAQ